MEINQPSVAQQAKSAALAGYDTVLIKKIFVVWEKNSKFVG